MNSLDITAALARHHRDELLTRADRYRLAAAARLPGPDRRRRRWIPALPGRRRRVVRGLGVETELG